MSFLATIAESIKSHADSRLRSPFAGAFVVAWLIVNWKPILLLILSETPIESRVDAFATSIDLQKGLLVPLVYSFAVTFVFYVGSIIFLAISNGYICIKHQLERRFDSVDWMDPSRYIILKERNSKVLARYKELAADSDREINEASLKIAELEKDLVEKSEELAAISKKFSIASTESAKATEELSTASSEIVSLRRRIKGVETALRVIREPLESLQNDLMSRRSSGALMPSPDDPTLTIRRPGTDSAVLEKINLMLQVLDSAK